MRDFKREFPTCQFITVRSPTSKRTLVQVVCGTEKREALLNDLQLRTANIDLVEYLFAKFARELTTPRITNEH